MAKNKKKAFTIVELVVAMGLLVLLVGLSSVVFSTTVKAHRKATATIEITRNLRVLTEQLNADFQGLRKDVPLMFWFDSRLTGSNEERFDMAHFFADGDFQTTKQYNDGTGNKTVYGDVARIFYGHANSPAAVSDFAAYQVLSRKSHILTADNDILTVYGEIPPITNSGTGLIDYTPFDNGANAFGVAMGSDYPLENELEFNTITLTDWINALNLLESPPAFPPATAYNADHFITYCLTDGFRPIIDLADSETLHLLMAQGVMEFSIQCGYTIEDLTTSATGYVPIPIGNINYFGGIRWWPSMDPDGDGNPVNSDFALMGNAFGAYLEWPGQTSNINWYRFKPKDTETPAQMASQRCRTQSGYFRQDFYPTALKFTFRLKDANNIFPAGKTFTHIVYLDN